MDSRRDPSPNYAPVLRRRLMADGNGSHKRPQTSTKRYPQRLEKFSVEGNEGLRNTKRGADERKNGGKTPPSLPPHTRRSFLKERGKGCGYLLRP